MVYYEDIDLKVTKLNDLANKVKTDDEVRKRIHENPLETMKELGIEVEDEFKEGVEKQLKAYLLLYRESIILPRGKEYH